MDAVRSTAGRSLAIVGAWLQLGMLFGLLGTVIGMMRSFNALASSAPADPSQMSDDIMSALTYTLAGSVVGLIGLCLIGVSVFAFGYRTEWLYRFLIVYGVILLFLVPIGTVIGIGLLMYCSSKRNEFLRPQSTANSRIAIE